MRHTSPEPIESQLFDSDLFADDCQRIAENVRLLLLAQIEMDTLPEGSAFAELTIDIIDGWMRKLHAAATEQVKERTRQSLAANGLPSDLPRSAKRG